VKPIKITAIWSIHATYMYKQLFKFHF